MNSKNATINKVHWEIQERIDKLRTKRQKLRFDIEEKYPEDLYGLKWQQIYDERSAKMDEEIKLLRQYDSGMYDLIELIEQDQLPKRGESE